MQTFRPDEIDLATIGTVDATSFGGAADGPTTRTATAIESTDGGFRSGVWDSAAGQRDFLFPTDEWAYIVEGEAHVTAAGETRVLRVGDVFYTPAGERMTWVVPTYVRKVWVHRRPPLTGRLVRKLRTIVHRRLGR